MGENFNCFPEKYHGAIDDSFVRKSIVERLPDILDTIISKNKSEELASLSLKEKLVKLIEEIRQGSFCIVPIDGSDGGPDWTGYCKGKVGLTCLQVDWFFLENYIYRLVLSAEYLDYFKSGVDPFRHHKAEALESGIASLKSPQPYNDSFESFQCYILASLWGNKMDLSLSSGKVIHNKDDLKSSKLLTDDTKSCWETTLGDVEKTSKPFTIIIILDNCGSELLNDLILCDYILQTFSNASIVLHAKSHPVFVSDAIESDIKVHIEKLSEMNKEISSRLANSKRLSVLVDPFYTSPLPFWDAPTHLKTLWKESLLTITKGDANYRRLLGDRIWPHRVPFDKIMQSYWDGSILAIRTCKAPVCVGLSFDELLLEPPSDDWLCNGKLGLLSFSSSSTTSSTTGIKKLKKNGG